MNVADTRIRCDGHAKLVGERSQWTPCGNPPTVRYREHPRQPWGYRCAVHVKSLDPAYVTIEPLS